MLNLAHGLTAVDSPCKAQQFNLKASVAERLRRLNETKKLFGKTK